MQTRMQLQANAIKAGGSAATGGIKPYTGVFDCARKVIAAEGVGGLYKGLSTLVTGSIPKAAIRFAAFNQFSQMLKDSDGTLTTSSRLLAGLGAGFSEAILAVRSREPRPIKSLV
jgi:solute carrier family 25 citrate transporter 1